ncbi:hypothetical protein F511_13270 [Dorcoceras hygrometricum]|uniref:Uncharacterized protein n=1 Tax=Dorcoceras hygrometricum TaxID=472368 RepID=A0A2Z7A3L9_9LAMI|nr:hypothetical protein F511_13270 [Dorcoceras hygrometricum]
MGEHDAAKNAFIGFREKLKAEGRSLVLEDLYFCKAIMNEYVVKINMPSTNYITNESKAFLPILVSSLQLNGVTFTGGAARIKLANYASSIQTSVVNAKNSSRIQASTVTGLSMVPAPDGKDSSIIPAPDVKYSSIIPAPAVIDSSIIPTPAVIEPYIFLAPAV